MSKIEYHLLKEKDDLYVAKPSNSDKFIRYIFILLVFAAIVYWYLSSHGSLYGSTQSHFFTPKEIRTPSEVDSLIQKWEEQEPVCSAPKILDQMPDDPFIKLYTKKKVLECNKTTIYTQLDQDTAMMTLTQEAIKDEVSCYYSFLWKSFDQDNYIDYSENELITESGVQFTNENDIANITCDKDGEEVYKNTHMWMRDLKSKVQPKANVPSVLILFLESLSSASFNHFMKKTKQSLDNLGNVFYLNGFVKHNDNSFPNSVSFLTGQRVDYDYEEKTFKHTYFDNVKPQPQYLWNDFSNKGYATGFLEDMAIVGIFNYAKWGWKKAPVDWYPRAYWVQMYPETGSFNIWNSMNLLEQFCFNVPKYEIFLDQVYHFMNKMNRNNQPYFLYAFYSQITHDDVNNYQMVDEPFAKFFDRTKDFYKNTLLVFAGDHGPRYGSPSVPSGYGRLEERMNLVTVRVPESLDEKYPYLKKYLTANKDRLTSWIDVHEMVKDVSRESYEPIRQVRKKSGAISPWREISHPERTCDDAYIFRAYCVCNGTISTDFRDPGKWDMRWAYKTVEKYVNSAIKNAKNDSSHDALKDCKDQSVNTTFVDMEYVIPKVGQDFMKDDIRIKVFLEPANVYLGTKVIVDHNGDKFNVDDDEERILKIVCKL